MRPRWLLEEMDVPYRLVRLDMAAGGHKQPDYVKINPNGAVPAIVDGDIVLFESAAICQYLADIYPERKMAPPTATPERAYYYQWIHYAMSGLEPPAEAVFMHTIMRPPEQRMAAVAEEARPRLVSALNVVEQALVGRDFIVGDRFTAADVMVGHTLAWAAMFFNGMPPNVSSYVERLTNRQAYQRAIAD